MMHPATARMLLFSAVITTIVVLAPWLAAQDDSSAPGLITQICTSLGIIDVPGETATRLPHRHP